MLALSIVVNTLKVIVQDLNASFFFYLKSESNNQYSLDFLVLGAVCSLLNDSGLALTSSASEHEIHYAH